MKKIFTYGTFVLFFLSYIMFLGNSGGAIAEVTEAPGEQHCGRSGCHNTMANTGNAGITIDFDNGMGEYSPNVTYNVKISLTNSQNTNRNGFEIVALDEQNQNVGEWIISGNDLQMKSGFSFTDRRYITQTSSGTGQTEWNMEWKSPNNDVGKVSFYLAVNDADGNGSTTNDNIYTTVLDITSPVSSINEISGIKVFDVYPNPFKDAFSITLDLEESKMLSAKLYNGYGQLVKSISLNNLNIGTNTISVDRLNDLSNGLYYLQLQDLEGRSKTLRILNY